MTLTEVLVACVVGSISFAAVYTGMGWGHANTQASRENLRATQIMVKRLEAIRLCSFDQITNTTYNPATFTEYFDPRSQPSGKGGTVYSGTFSAIVPPSGTVPDSYRSNMLLVTVGVTWRTARIPRSTSLQTYVAQKGMEGYVSIGR